MSVPADRPTSSPCRVRILHAFSEPARTLRHTGTENGQNRGFCKFTVIFTVASFIVLWVCTATTACFHFPSPPCLQNFPNLSYIRKHLYPRRKSVVFIKKATVSESRKRWHFRANAQNHPTDRLRPSAGFLIATVFLPYRQSPISMTDALLFLKIKTPAYPVKNIREPSFSKYTQNHALSSSCELQLYKAMKLHYAAP